MSEQEPLSVRRLGNAGVEISSQGTSIVIDLFEDNSPLEPFVGPAQTILPPPERSGALAALVTHLHSDHADPAAIARALADAGVVLRPERSGGEGLDVAGLAVAEAGFAELTLEQREMAWWDRAELGPFAVTAVPAVDGFGDPQISWVVEVEGVRIFHGGDTLFHGWWWPIRERCGPIDIALLPINGPSVDLPHKQPPHDLPSALDPRQAANAAAILRAKLAVGIHYDTFNHEPTYVQVREPAERFAEEAGKLGVATVSVGPGEPVELG